MSKIVWLATIAAFMAGAATQAETIVYPGDFTGSTLADAGLVASAGAADGSWTLNTTDNTVDGVGGGNARSNVSTIDSWRSPGGFKLDVTFTTSAAMTRYSFGLVDAAYTISSSGDWLNSSAAGAYGIGFSTAGSGTNDYLGFNNDAGTVTELSVAQGDATLGTTPQTLSITITSTNWSYSLNGAPATTGTHVFDTGRSYVFTSHAQRNHNAKFQNITLTALPDPEDADWMEGKVGVGWRFSTGQGAIDGWNVTTLVNQVKTIPGIDYVLFNLSEAAHGDKYIAPHSVLTTLNPGCTSTNRDLFMEAATAFQSQGYKVLAYVACQGPPMLKHGVQYAWDRVEIEPGVYFSQSMENWSNYVDGVYGNTTRDTYKQAFAEIIIDEYAERYGTLIDGWWFDNGAGSMNAPLLHDVVTAYNTNTMITFNGVNVDTDYTGGHPTVLGQALPSDDVNETKLLLPIEATPDGYLVQADGHKALGHMFMPAHDRWNAGPIVWPVDKAADWVERCTQAGGAWTWNVDATDGASNLRADTVTLMQDIYAKIAENATNNAPVFASDPIDGGAVDSFGAYSNSVAGLVTDAEGDTLRFHKLDGPDWLAVSTNGTLSGIASTLDMGTNRFKIQVGDGKGNVAVAELEITVDYAFIARGVVDKSRFNAYHIDSGLWVKRDADWTMTDGTLLNPGLVADDEKGAHLLNSVNSSSTTTQITVSFDYSVGAGSTLYFYSTLFTGQLTNDFLSARLTQNSSWYAGDFNNDVSSFGGFSGPEYNLKDGSTPSGTTDSALASFVGGTSGTYSNTFNIASFGGGSFSMADVSHMLAVFTANTAAAGDGAMLIDNFNMTFISGSATLDPIGDITLGGVNAAGDLVFSWDTADGQSYNVETNADMVVPNWGIYTNIVGDGAAISFTNTPEQAQLFYKVTSE